MKTNDIAALREALEQKDTRLLEDMLLEELRKDAPSGERIRLISDILKERDSQEPPVIDDKVRQAWERYLAKTRPVHKKPTGSFLLKAASLLLAVLALVALVPQEARAMNLFGRFMAWTEDIFSLISPAEAREWEQPYEFRTDNPGLRQIYDEVTALGVTAPVVPMWLPEGYELVECEVEHTNAKTYLTATFSNGCSEFVYQLDIYAENVTCEYYKNGTNIRTKEKNGINHTIMDNDDVMVAIWAVENVECSIFIDCPEDVLNKILESIYTVEES